MSNKMIIVNTTFCLHPDTEAEVLSWIDNAYLPSARKYGSTSSMLTQVLNADSPTYALHVNFPTLEEAVRWCNGVGAQLRDILAKRYGERALTFHTMLKVVRDGV